MGKEDLKQIVVRVSADTKKALKMYCALTDKKLQNLINDAIVEKLKFEYLNADDEDQYEYIIDLLPYDGLRPNYRARTMEQVFKDPSGRVLYTRLTDIPAPIDEEMKKENANMKRKITRLKKECIEGKRAFAYVIFNSHRPDDTYPEVQEHWEKAKKEIEKTTGKKLHDLIKV